MKILDKQKVNKCVCACVRAVVKVRGSGGGLSPLLRFEHPAIV